MGCNFLFSGSSNYDKDTKTTPNPNKYNFTIRKIISSSSNYSLVLVNYPDCTTFNGDKLIVANKGYLDSLNELDPHFFEDGNIVARFIPSQEGRELAIAFMEMINGKD